MRIKCLFPLVLLVAVGCSTLTNLTPSHQIRNATGLYPFEVEWASRQHALRTESVKAYVVIDLFKYPMQRTALLSNRWETLVPIPTDQRHITYRYRFDYDYDAIPRPKSDSKLSPPYQLTLTPP